MPLPFFFFDPTMVLLIPPLLLALWAQWKVKSTYSSFSQVDNRAGMTGADVARQILRDNNIGVVHGQGSGSSRTCGLETVPGELSDHYDPKAHVLRLSEGVYHGRSVAALGIAAHEVGHAIQHAENYSPLTLRNIIYPVSSIGSTLAFPLFIAGLFISPGIGQPLMYAAIGLFTLAVTFTVLTLPVEFDASRRALASLDRGGYLKADEMKGARKVLTAAAMTYVASAAMAIMQLVRLLLIANSRD
jgi:uncharacterized protein